MQTESRAVALIASFVIGFLLGIIAVAMLACASTRAVAADSAVHQALEYKLANSLFKARCKSLTGPPASLVAPCAQVKIKLDTVFNGLHDYGNKLAACAAVKASCNAEKKLYLQNEELYTRLFNEIQEALDP